MGRVYISVDAFETCAMAKAMELVGDTAVATWVRSVTHCNRCSRDGLIVDLDVRGLVRGKRWRRVVDAMVASGLWVRVDGGYMLAGLGRDWRPGPVEEAWDKRHVPAVYERDGHACRYCGRSDVPLSIDHVVPRIGGGSDEAENLVVACRSCNSRKGGRTPEQAGMSLRGLDS